MRVTSGRRDILAWSWILATALGVFVLSAFLFHRAGIGRDEGGNAERGAHVTVGERQDPSGSLWGGVPRGSDTHIDDREANGSMVTDFSDRRRLVGFADAVFVGRVVGQVGNQGIETSAPGTTIAQNQFRVEVLRTIKSVRRVAANQIQSLPANPVSLPDAVIVNQYARGVNGQGLLVPGRTYLLAATYDHEKRQYDLLGTRYGLVPADDAKARAAAVQAFLEAKANEIPLRDINDPLDE